MGESGVDKSMKILMVQHRFPPAIGGSERHTYLLSKGLIKKGHDVVIYTTNSLTNEDVLSLPFFKREAEKPNLSRKEEVENIKVNRFDIAFRYWSFNWIPEMFKKLKATAHEFDIIHAHGYHITSSLAGCYYAKKCKKPFILTAHDLIIPDDLPTDAKLFKKIYDKTFGRYLLKNSTRLIALTEDQIQQYAERGGDVSKIRIIPNGIELDKYRNAKTNPDIIAKYGIDDVDKVLLFVGRIDKYKGIQDVIEAMPVILSKHHNIKFIVVGGDYGYESELKELSKKLNVDKSVVFTGNISKEELIELYKRADIFVFPSKMEGFGIVLLEAMASGTLCIAYSIPSVRKIIKDNENGVLVKNKKELLDKILYYLDNIVEKKKIETNALGYVEKYDIKKIVNSIEKVYEEALN